MKNRLLLLITLIAIHSTYAMEETPPNRQPNPTEQIIGETLAKLVASFQRDVGSETQPLYSADTEQSPEQIEELRNLIQRLLLQVPRSPTPPVPQKKLPAKKEEIPTNFLEMIDRGYRFSFFDSNSPDTIIVHGKKIESKLIEEWTAPRELKKEYIRLQQEQLMKPQP